MWRYADKLSGVPYRVGAIEHTITPERWTVNLEFATPDTVSQPVATPGPRPAAGGGAYTPPVMPSLILYMTATQNIPNGVVTTLTFNGVETSNADWGFTGTEITFPESGLYLITAHLMWASATSGRREAEVDLNTTTTVARSEMWVSGGGAPSNVIVTEAFVNAGDTLKMRAYQSSGGTLATSVASRPRLYR